MDKSFKKILFCLLAVSLVMPLVSQAVSIPNPLKAETFEQLLNSIIDFLFYLALGITPLMIVIAGFYFITAQGDPKKVETAQTIIKWAIIGFIIVICAKGLVQLLKSIFQK